MENKYFKIIPIQHLMKNNEFGKSGEIYKGDKFIDLTRSLTGKYCKEATQEEMDDAGIELDSENDGLNLEDKSKKELIAFAKENNLSLPEEKNPNKNVLLDFITEQLDK